MRLAAAKVGERAKGGRTELGVGAGLLCLAGNDTDGEQVSGDSRGNESVGRKMDESTAWRARVITMCPCSWVEVGGRGVVD